MKTYRGTGGLSDARQSEGPTKSARFRLEVGSIFLGLTCPDDDTLKARADFAMLPLDKAEAMRTR